MTHLKILLVSQFRIPHVGGLSRVFLDQVNLFSDKGCEVSMVTIDALPFLVRMVGVSVPAYILEKVHKGAGTLWTDSILAWLMSVVTRKRIRTMIPDVILSHDVLSFHATNSAKPQHSRQLLYVHDYYANARLAQGLFHRSCPFYYKCLEFEREAYREATTIVAVDSRIRSWIARNSAGVGLVRVILNYPLGISSLNKAEGEMIRKRLDLDSSAQVVLVPRRLVKKNGVEYAIRAAELVCAKLRRSIFLIAGSGPEEAQLRALTASLGVEGSIRFLGEIAYPSMRRVYAAADLVVIPSIELNGVAEASSLAAQEAMAYGLPVIASSIGGLTEIISDMKTGILVPEKDPRKLADAVIVMLTHPELRETIGREAAATMQARSTEFEEAVWNLVSDISIQD